MKGRYNGDANGLTKLVLTNLSTVDKDDQNIFRQLMTWANNLTLVAKIVAGSGITITKVGPGKYEISGSGGGPSGQFSYYRVAATTHGPSAYGAGGRQFKWKTHFVTELYKSSTTAPRLTVVVTTGTVKFKATHTGTYKLLLAGSVTIQLSLTTTPSHHATNLFYVRMNYTPLRNPMLADTVVWPASTTVTKGWKLPWVTAFKITTPTGIKFQDIKLLTGYDNTTTVHVTYGVCEVGWTLWLLEI